MKKYLILISILFSFAACKQSVFNTENNSNKSSQNYVKHFRPGKEDVIQKIAFGSCSNQLLDQKYWKTINDKLPDLWIWMGDAIYSDTENMKEHKKAYEVMKRNPYYQDFINDVPVIGVWDDHDYGANDGDKTYPKKEESKELFLDFLDIPDTANVRKHKGVYDSYVIGKGVRKIKIFLLDNRTFKDKLVEDTVSSKRYIPDSTGTVLGEEQWTWLENEIKNSDATVNIFISGLQIIPDDHPYEKWGDFPNERRRFLDLLEKYKVKNPLIFSGDRHFAEFSEYTYIDFTGNVLELTVSGLTHSYKGVDEFNAYRLGYVFDGKNFGFLKISWAGTKVLMKLFIYDINGVEKLQHGIIADY